MGRLRDWIDSGRSVSRRTPLERRLGLSFRDASLLERALCHRSYSHQEWGERQASNERLEFLGDAVIDLVVSDHLCRVFPDFDEGELTQMRAALVNRDGLAAAARRIDLGGDLRLSVDEVRRGGSRRSSILADGYEALVGAIFVDRGLDAVRRFLGRHLLADADRLLAEGGYRNPKNRLQEMFQRAGHSVPPTYTTRSKDGPAHAPRYLVDVVVNGRVLGTGTGGTKRRAQTRAADNALRSLPETIDDVLVGRPPAADRPPSPELFGLSPN